MTLRTAGLDGGGIGELETRPRARLDRLGSGGPLTGALTALATSPMSASAISLDQADDQRVAHHERAFPSDIPAVQSPGEAVEQLELTWR